MPATSASSNTNARLDISFIVILLLPLLLMGFSIFFRNPMPGIQTADDQSRKQQRQCPRMIHGMVPIQPDTERRAKQRWHNYRPPDQPDHAQPGPDCSPDMALFPLRLQFALRPGSHETA